MTKETESGRRVELGDMSVEEFRRGGHRLIDWIADYFSRIERFDVLSRCRPGDVKKQLPKTPPEQPESIGTILDDFESEILPGVTHWNHPAFLGYFGSTGSSPGVLGELLCAALNVNGMLWKTAPAATELEEVVLDWLRQLLGLSADFRGVLMDTASTGTLTAVIAARERVPGVDVREEGLHGVRLRLYTSEQAHSSVEKAAIAAGIGRNGVRKIPVDEEYRMRPDALVQAIAEDRAAGWIPFCVTATIGTTSTTSIDPVAEIATICQSEGLWLHVDAAYAGMAAILPEYRDILDGCEHADSFIVNPHKWLFTPVDCSALFVRDPATLQRVFSLVPAYLQTGESAVTNYMDWGIPLGRRFRALKLWMVLRAFGREGLIARLREHIRLAHQFAEWVDESADFVRAAPTPFSTVCFRYEPPSLRDPAALDRANRALLDAVNGTGSVFLSHTELEGRFTLRLAVGNVRTTERHVARAWELLQAHRKTAEQVALRKSEGETL